MMMDPVWIMPRASRLLLYMCICDTLLYLRWCAIQPCIRHLPGVSLHWL